MLHTFTCPNYRQLPLLCKIWVTNLWSRKVWLEGPSSVCFQNQGMALPSFVLTLFREWSIKVNGGYKMSSLFKNFPRHSPPITDTFKLTSFLFLWVFFKSNNSVKVLKKRKIRQKLFEVSWISSSWQQPYKEFRKKSETEWIQNLA